MFEATGKMRIGEEIREPFGALQFEVNVKHGDAFTAVHASVTGVSLGWRGDVTFWNIEDAERLAGALNNMIQQWREINERESVDKRGLSSEAG